MERLESFRSIGRPTPGSSEAEESQTWQGDVTTVCRENVKGSAGPQKWRVRLPGKTYERLPEPSRPLVRARGPV
jgi:hypothetical protein